MHHTFLNLLTQNDFQDFLFSNENLDEKELVLKHKSVFEIPCSIIANQISGRRKAKLKLPTFYNTKGIVYPPGINIEQCSSEATAQFKVEIIRKYLNKSETRGVDLTGGLGIDSFFFSKNCSSLHYVEKEEFVLQFANHNHVVLGATNIEHHQIKAEEFINSTRDTFDFIFVDPSRRIKETKVFKFIDCEPNVYALLPQLFKHANLVLIKASPLLDLQQGIKELQFVKSIYVVSVENECKEVLFLCERDFTGEPTIYCVDLSAQRKSIQFTFTEERNSEVQYSEPLSYLYEPNASILKAGAFKFIGNKFSLNKLQTNTHLYTSHELVENFPGRVFKIEMVNPKESDLKKYFPYGKANVATRNYPLSADELKKKLKLKDGSDLFLFGVTSLKKRVLLITRRVSNL